MKGHRVRSCPTPQMAKEGLGESGVGALCPNHVEGGLMKRWCLRRENSAQHQTASVHDLTDSSSSRRRARGSRAEVDTAGCSSFADSTSKNGARTISVHSYLFLKVTGFYRPVKPSLKEN